MNDNNYNSSPYPEEFKSLIERKVKLFCGRQFVFDSFNRFCTQNTNGYFTIIGEAGMGKTSIAAKYVFDHQSPCYFNILTNGRNRPELFLKSIREQLINRYQLADLGNVKLLTLLEKVIQKLPASDKLVIAIDALDEVNQKPGTENILYLPKTLPDRVYFLLTKGSDSSNKERLFTEGVKQEELYLIANQYMKFNYEDIKAYIRFFINAEPEHKYNLTQWIQTRNVTVEIFVERLADKSKNNFMYLYYVLPSIARGFYDDLSLKELPNGLESYYQDHWVRMKMDTEPKTNLRLILFVLVSIAQPITSELVAKILEIKENDVQLSFNEWIDFLNRQELEGEICYSIYHTSFFYFLKAQAELGANRELFKNVNQRIVDYLEGQIA